MRTAMLLVAVGQAAVTVAAAWELLAGRRRPPGVPYPEQQLAALSWERGVVALPDHDMADLGGRTGSPPGGGGVIVDRVP